MKFILLGLSHAFKTSSASSSAPLPVCIAKTQYSFSDDAKLLGRAKGFIFSVKDLDIRTGAGFIVAVCGKIMLMPGLPKVPAAVNMRIDADGKIDGLS